MTSGITRIRDRVNRLGRLVSAKLSSGPATIAGGATILAIRVKVVINLFCDSFADAGDALDLGETGARDGAGRPEMMQQGLLAAGADAGDLVERRLTDRLGPPRAVGADRKAVRLVAQPLQEIQDRVARLERKGRPAGQKEPFAAGVAVGS